jgi:hypothetical protein
MAKSKSKTKTKTRTGTKTKSEKRRYSSTPKRRSSSNGGGSSSKSSSASRAGRQGNGGGSASATHSAASGLFGHTADAVRTALSLQDEWVRSWSDFIDQSTRLADSQQEWQKSVAASVPAAQRSIRAYMDMVERTSRSGIEWMQTALDFAAAPGAVWEAGTRAHELARRSIDLVQTGARAAAEANREVVESWDNAMRNGGEVARATARSVEQVGRLSRATARKTARSSTAAARKITRSASAAGEQATRAVATTAKAAA